MVEQTYRAVLEVVAGASAVEVSEGYAVPRQSVDRVFAVIVLTLSC